MKFPKTREEAIAKGSKYYSTGVPCKNGHLSLRYTSRGQCKSCTTKASRKRRGLTYKESDGQEKHPIEYSKDDFLNDYYGDVL